MVFGGAFEKQGGRAAFEAQKKKLIEQGFVPASLFENPIKTEACLVNRPKIGKGIFMGKGGAFLVGEAAGLISPSSFEGISYALDSSEALADAMTNNTEATSILHAYRRGTRRLTRRIALRYLKRPFMYQPLLRSAVMKSGIASLHIRKGDHT